MRRRLILHETRFTRSRFFTAYFIDIDTFYLFLNWFSTRVSDDWKSVCGRRLYACINTRKFKGLDSREITSLPVIKKKWFTWPVISIITKNKPHAHHKTICIQCKFTTPDNRSFANCDYYFFQPLSSVHSFQSNQSFQAIEFVDRVDPFRKSSIWHFYSMDMKFSK